MKERDRQFVEYSLQDYGLWTLKGISELGFAKKSAYLNADQTKPGLTKKTTRYFDKEAGKKGEYVTKHIWAKNNYGTRTFSKSIPGYSISAKNAKIHQSILESSETIQKIVYQTYIWHQEDINRESMAGAKLYNACGMSERGYYKAKARLFKLILGVLSERS